MHRWIVSVQEYYARLNAYIFQVGLPYDIDDLTGWDEEGKVLRAVMGEANGGNVLDCSCGWGKQAIALATLGWQVTATDVSGSSLDFAQRCANDVGVRIAFRVCDMRDLVQHFDAAFDWVVSCYALYELATDAEIQRAVNGMFHALKPGGNAYIRLRDMDDLMEDQPRHTFHGEKRVPHGRIICIDDWDYESETHVVDVTAFLREDERRNDHFRWVTDTIGCRKRVLRKVELVQFLQTAGFDSVTFVPQPTPWMPLEVVARKPFP